VRRYLLGTGPLAAYLQGRPRAVELIDPWLIRHEAAPSMLVYGEVMEYLMALPDFARRRDALRGLLMEVYPYLPTSQILERYAEIRRPLRPPQDAGLIGDLDTFIAATAIQGELVVVTTDHDFTRGPGLEVLILDRRRLSAGFSSP
jgi:predicted nucleic acid-binding protein